MGFINFKLNLYVVVKGIRLPLKHSKHILVWLYTHAGKLEVINKNEFGLRVHVREKGDYSTTYLAHVSLCTRVCEVTYKVKKQWRI